MKQVWSLTHLENLECDVPKSGVHHMYQDYSKTKLSSSQQVMITVERGEVFGE